MERDRVISSGSESTYPLPPSMPPLVGSPGSAISLHMRWKPGERAWQALWGYALGRGGGTALAPTCRGAWMPYLRQAGNILFFFQGNLY